MRNDPFFSVVVPTFNRVEKLLSTLATILKQTFADFELIVVDDGSTDGTPDILKEKITDERLRIISQVNSERGAARNNGFRQAKGKYVVFFDSDDLMHENHLAVLHKNILAEKEPDFIATKFDFIDEAGKRRPSDMHRLGEGSYNYTLFLDGNPLACNVCVRKGAQSLIPFEEDRRYSIKEDWLFLISNMKTHRLFIVDETTVSMLDHDDRSMRSDNSLIITRTRLAMQWIVERVELTTEDAKRLVAHVNYFCGIHSYLDNNRNDAIGFTINAMRSGGLKLKYVALLIKSIAGRKMMKAIRR